MCTDDMLSSENSTSRSRDTYLMLAASTSHQRKQLEERHVFIHVHVCTFPLVWPARYTPSLLFNTQIIIWRWGQGSSWPDKSTPYHDTQHSQHSQVNGDFRKRRYVDLFSTLALPFPYFVQSGASHVQLDTRPSSFSVCNIEKLGGAWG